VLVVQPRHREVPAEVDDLRALAGNGFDFFPRPDGNEGAVLDRYCFDPRLFVVDRVDLTVGVDGVGFLRIGVRTEEEQAENHCCYLFYVDFSFEWE
jgi:hypothetical protein